MESYLGPGEPRSGAELPVPLQEIQTLLGDSLRGILLFGSAARGEERQSSDIDLLIVVETSLPLTRSLYGLWDRGIEGASGSAISPHFVHLPDSEGKLGSLWYEAAIEGIVLYERDACISKLLRRVRRSMAEGKVQRKSAYGHPYWVRSGEETTDVQ